MTAAPLALALVTGEVPPILSAPELVRGFKPIESIVAGLPIGRANVVTLTGQTGSGKTTLACALQIAFVRGSRFAGRDVTAGSVLVLNGENPDDSTMHLIATLQDQGLTAQDMLLPASGATGELLVISGRFSIDFGMDELHARVKALNRQLVAVFVDTSAAYYESQDENDNVAMLRHAATMRELTTLPGRPTVVVMCHPTKGATRDNLLPRGGGAFLTQVDANLTVWKDDSGIVTVHWAGKIRGPSFDPIRFEIVGVELAGYRDCRGDAIVSSAVRHLADARVEQLEHREINDQDRLLIGLRKTPGASVADLACEAGMVNAEGEPLKSKTDRRLKTLEALGLAVRDRKGKWSLTLKGMREAEALPC